MSDPYFEQGLPREIEAERAVLGAILLDQNLIDQAVSAVPTEDLFLDSHRRIYRAMATLASSGQLIDIVTLPSELRRNGELEQVGGVTYLSSLIDGVPRTDTIKPYAKLIKEAALKRKLISTCNVAISELFDGELTFAEIIQATEEQIFSLAESRRDGTGPEHVSVISARLIDFYEQKSLDPKKLIGLSLGYEDLDRRTLGLTEGLTLIAARPSMGKTAMAINVSCNVALRGNGSVFFASLESGAEKIVQRILASEARIDSQRMRTGNMNKDEWARLHDALQALSVCRFVVDDTPDLSPEELASRARQYQAQYGLDLLVVDYIQLMARRLQYVRRYKDLRIAVQEVGAKLVGLSRQLGVPVLGIAQLSRGVDDRADHRPQMSDLAESASLEQDADLVLFILREEQYKRTDTNRGIATIIFGKQRDGGTDEDVSMAYIRGYTRFESLAQKDWPISQAERQAAEKRRRDYIKHAHEDPEEDEE